MNKPKRYTIEEIKKLYQDWAVDPDGLTFLERLSSLQEQPEQPKCEHRAREYRKTTITRCIACGHEEEANMKHIEPEQSPPKIEPLTEISQTLKEIRDALNRFQFDSYGDLKVTDEQRQSTN